MTPSLEDLIPERVFKYELGKKRPDGKVNVWTKMDVRGFPPEWVVVHVADNRGKGLEWIHRTLEQERKAA